MKGNESASPYVAGTLYYIYTKFPAVTSLNPARSHGQKIIELKYLHVPPVQVIVYALVTPTMVNPLPHKDPEFYWIRLPVSVWSAYIFKVIDAPVSNTVVSNTL